MPGIDMHTHLAPSFDEAANPAPGVARDANGRLQIDGHAIGPAALYAPAALGAQLEKLGLDEAVVSMPPPFFRQHLSEEDSSRWVRAANAGIRQAVADDHRLVPLAYLPLEHPRLAQAIYDEVRADARFGGVVASAGGRSVSLADPALASLWGRLDDDRRLMLLHPAISDEPRLQEFYLHNLLGNPVETAVAAGQLVMGGVLARYPRMRILLVHCGGCVPALVGRWERGVQTSRPGVLTDIEPPARAVRRLYADCLAHDPWLIDRAITLFGADKLVLGSDWPFPMGIDDPRACLGHRSADEVDRIATHNARSALGRDG